MAHAVMHRDYSSSGRPKRQSDFRNRIQYIFIFEEFCYTSRIVDFSKSFTQRKSLFARVETSDPRLVTRMESHIGWLQMSPLHFVVWALKRVLVRQWCPSHYAQSNRRSNYNPFRIMFNAFCIQFPFLHFTVNKILDSRPTRFVDSINRSTINMW